MRKFILIQLLALGACCVYANPVSQEEAFATGISTITYDNNPAASRIYDLSGRQLSTRPEKGLYIRGKKKILK